MAKTETVRARRITMRVKHQGLDMEPWTEEFYTRAVTDATVWCSAMIDWFNDGLSKNEKPREFVDATDHGWVDTEAHKLSNFKIRF